jgi:hypothetical protein
MTMFWLETGCYHWKVTWQIALMDELITLIPPTGWVVLELGSNVPVLPLFQKVLPPLLLFAGGIGSEIQVLEPPLLLEPLLPFQVFEPPLANVVVTERWSE